jgi:hypothetical protein
VFDIADIIAGITSLFAQQGGSNNNVYGEKMFRFESNDKQVKKSDFPAKKSLFSQYWRCLVIRDLRKS